MADPAVGGRCVVNHLKPYADAEEAGRSKAASRPGAVIVTDCPCTFVHVRQAKEPKARIPAQRAKPGSMSAAVALVLAGEATVAEAARRFECDPVRLEDRCWADARRVVMERQDWTCAAGPEIATDVHHRDPKGMGGTSDPVAAFGAVSLVALCRRHHDLAHSGDREMADRGYMLKTGQNPAEVPVYIRSEWGWERFWLLADGGLSRVNPLEGRAA